MPKRVEVPGVGIIEFPDNMPDERISGIIRTQFAKPEPMGVNRPRTTQEMIDIEGGGLQEQAGPVGLLTGAALAPARPIVGAMSAIPSLLEPAASVSGTMATQAGEKLTGQPIEAPTGGQGLTEMGLGTGGAIAGTMVGGRAGGAVGAAGGTFLGGILSGRSPMNALIDAAQQGGLEYLSSGIAGLGTKAIQKIVPPVSEASKAALESPKAEPTIASLLTGGPRPTQAEFGTKAEGAIRQEFDQAQKIAGKAYDMVRSKIPSLDLQDIYTLAEQNGIKMPRMGVEVAKGTIETTAGTTPGRMTFGSTPGSVGAVVPPKDIPGPTIDVTSADIGDAIKIRSLLGEQARGLRRSGDAIEAAAVEQVHRALASKIRDAADDAGVGGALKAADQFFKTQIAERFQNETVQNIMQTAGKQVLDQLSPELVMGKAARGNLQDATAIREAITRLTTAYPNALPEFRAGIVSSMLEKSTSPQNGTIRPDIFLRQVSAPGMQPEVLETLLGPEIAKGVKEFAQNYAKATTRGALAVGAVGEAATIATAGQISPGAMMGAGLEITNELNMLGRMFVRSPSISKRLVASILGGHENAARKITGLKTLRILGTEGAGQLGRQLIEAE